MGCRVGAERVRSSTKWCDGGCVDRGGKEPKCKINKVAAFLPDDDDSAGRCLPAARASCCCTAAAARAPLPHPSRVAHPPRYAAAIYIRIYTSPWRKLAKTQHHQGNRAFSLRSRSAQPVPIPQKSVNPSIPIVPIPSAYMLLQSRRDCSEAHLKGLH